MIEHTAHTDIEKERWDAGLLACSNRLWYAQRWVLDLACPRWEALVDEESGAMMPLTWRRKWGVDYLFQPLGLQQLGVFAPEAAQADLIRFLVSIPARFRYWDIAVQEMPGLRGLLDGRVVQRVNQTLRMDRSIDQLRTAYAKNHLRNLKRDDGLERTDMDVKSFAGLFRATTGARFGADAVHGFDEFTLVMEEGVRRGQCVVRALKKDDEVLAAACFATWEGRSILLKSANTARGQDAHAMFRLIDDWVAEHAGSGILLDFAGSNTPGVARFNAGFGAESGVYLRLVRNRLPMPIRWLKR